MDKEKMDVRELTEKELEQVSGGAAITGLIGIANSKSIEAIPDEAKLKYLYIKSTPRNNTIDSARIVFLPEGLTFCSILIAA